MPMSVLFRRTATAFGQRWLPAVRRSPAVRYSTEVTGAPVAAEPPTAAQPAAAAPVPFVPEVRNFLQSLGLGQHEAALLGTGTVRSVADLRKLSKAKFKALASMSDAHIEKLLLALKTASLEQMLEAAALPKAYREKFAALGVWGPQDVRDPKAFEAVSKVLKAEEMQALLLTLKWRTLTVGPTKQSAVLQLPQQAVSLLDRWMGAVGRQAGHRHTLEDVLHELYFRVNSSATEEAWAAEFARCKAGSLVKLAQELVARLLPSMASFLPSHIGTLGENQHTADVLYGLMHPQRPSLVSGLLRPTQDESTPGAEGERKRPQRLPADVLMALRALFSGFPQLMAEEWAEATQSRRTREYFRELADALRSAIATEKDPQRLKQLRNAADTLQRTQRLSLKGLPTPIPAKMAAWKVARAEEDRKARWAKARNAHWTRVMAGLPNDLLYSCSEVTDVADFWEQPFFERMMVWWKLNAMYDLQFPDFHRTAGRGRELQPRYRTALIPDELDRSL